MMEFKRIFTIVLDSVGVGSLPDAAKYNDEGANTLLHIWEACKGLNIPNLLSLGLEEIVAIPKTNKPHPQSFVTKLGEISLGKDTMTGHWEMMGLNVDTPFVTFTDTGFPKELLDELEKASGRKIVGNKAASGTEILDELGEHQMKTGELIVYTSADSVLQIAAHEEIIPLEELYRICEVARALTMRDEWKVGRIIARPYVGSGKGQFKRTPNRHDYAIKPFSETALDKLKNNSLDVISVGKINDIFDGEGITQSFPIKSNAHGMETIMELTKTDFKGLLFANLVDFDAVFGHRRNPLGYGQSLEEFDVHLGQLIPMLQKDDLLILTADHGTDPVHHGTDHTREYVPLLFYNETFQEGGKLKEGSTFANIGATILDNFSLEKMEYGESYLPLLK